MFFYLYDQFVLDKKNEQILHHIESRIIELGINGRVERLTLLRNLKEIIDLGLKHGAHTFVVVGSDETWLRAMNILADQAVTLALIPITPKVSTLASLFGIDNAIEACNILSRRITKTLALAKANQNHFLTELQAAVPAGTIVRCNDAFRLELQRAAQLTIKNSVPATHGVLVEIQPSPIRVRLWQRKPATGNAATKLPVRKVTIEHPTQSVMVTLDNTTTLKLPITITLKPKTLKVIVGKNRRLA